jgi:phenylpropionate dioxygenase-like ring-hydroxylating dioxygenase large terminal subunit
VNLAVHPAPHEGRHQTQRQVQPGHHPAPAYPTHSWYVAATVDEVSTAPLARRALDTSLVIYRTSAGATVVLEDRDAHSPYPLSRGRVQDDLIISSYSGFAYAADGRCVRVPTQVEVPYGARVRCFPVREQDGLVWVWFGEPGVAELRKPHRVPWLTDPAWATFGDQWTTEASFLLLHENFADITHVAVVDPELAPPVLSAGSLPSLEVEVTETSVSFRRDYPPSALAAWHAALLGVAADTPFLQREEGKFVTPGLWVDSWRVLDDEAKAVSTFRFTHAVTPVDATSTRHVWRVSTDFAPDADQTEQLLQRFSDYYLAVKDILRTMQEVLCLDGPRPDVSVAADAAALQVRRIVGRMVADERLA